MASLARTCSLEAAVIKIFFVFGLVFINSVSMASGHLSFSKWVRCYSADPKIKNVRIQVFTKTKGSENNAHEGQIQTLHLSYFDQRDKTSQFQSDLVAAPLAQDAGTFFNQQVMLSPLRTSKGVMRLEAFLFQKFVSYGGLDSEGQWIDEDITDEWIVHCPDFYSESKTRQKKL